MIAFVSQADLYALTGVALFVIGLYGLTTRPHLLHKIMALNISGSGAFLVYAAIARRVQGAVPDPVPHAMVLTGIVVTVAATALALALAKNIYTATGVAALDAEDVLKEVEGVHG